MKPVQDLPWQRPAGVRQPPGKRGSRPTPLQPTRHLRGPRFNPSRANGCFVNENRTSFSSRWKLRFLCTATAPQDFGAASHCNRERHQVTFSLLQLPLRVEGGYILRAGGGRAVLQEGKFSPWIFTLNPEESCRRRYPPGRTSPSERLRRSRICATLRLKLISALSCPGVWFLRARCPGSRLRRLSLSRHTARATGPGRSELCGAGEAKPARDGVLVPERAALRGASLACEVSSSRAAPFLFGSPPSLARL
ncbi:PREDICTED: uncharacterized protein LOC109279329 [Aptenodytes forsteri]|uniref:uncharacterized protein LOC109279329 n=1 Tax=Aptenodytes forsteri TaxID=9233 RepID=UPI0009058968|nr:PREDICTED: uncharacterized protein LOC109279329 [Aptenodytes forsteri]